MGLPVFKDNCHSVLQDCNCSWHTCCFGPMRRDHDHNFASYWYITQQDYYKTPVPGKQTEQSEKAEGRPEQSLCRLHQGGEIQSGMEVGEVPCLNIQEHDLDVSGETAQENDTQGGGKMLSNGRGHSVVHWFRRGLRFHDNPSLLEALTNAETLRCIYVLDPWFAGSSQASIVKWR